MIISDKSEFLNLRQEWNALAMPTPWPTVSHEWLTAAAIALPDSASLKVITVQEENGTLLAAAPIISQARSLYLSFLGSHCFVEPSTFLYRDQAALAKLLDALQGLGSPLKLIRLPAKSFPEEMGVSLKSTRGVHFVSAECGSPYLRISGPWSMFEESLSARRKSDLRRAYRKAEKFGIPELTITSPETETAEQLLQEYFALEERSWKGAAGTAVSQDPISKRFFLHLVREMAGIGALRVSQMKINEKLVAMVLALQYRGSLWTLKVAHDEYYKNCSPGILLMHRTIEYAFQQQLRTFEFLGTPDSWIELWTKELRPYVTLRVYHPSLQSTNALCREFCVKMYSKITKRKHLSSKGIA